VGATDTRERVGLWGMKTLPASTWGSVLVKELVILRIPVSRFSGEKLMFTGLGFRPPACDLLHTGRTDVDDAVEPRRPR
jgi:hypothetical protein